MERDRRHYGNHPDELKKKGLRVFNGIRNFLETKGLTHEQAAIRPIHTIPSELKAVILDTESKQLSLLQDQVIHFSNLDKHVVVIPHDGSGKIIVFEVKMPESINRDEFADHLSNHLMSTSGN